LSRQLDTESTHHKDAIAAQSAMNQDLLKAIEQEKHDRIEAEVKSRNNEVKFFLSFHV
jgi:hypothetical protein